MGTVVGTQFFCDLIRRRGRLLSVHYVSMYTFLHYRIDRQTERRLLLSFVGWFDLPCPDTLTRDETLRNPPPVARPSQVHYVFELVLGVWGVSPSGVQGRTPHEESLGDFG